MKKMFLIAGLCLISSTLTYAAPKPHHQKMVLSSWHRAMKPAKIYSKEEAKTLSQAAIILYGNKSMQVEKIDSVKNKKGRMRYLINISDKKHHQMKSLIMNPRNGVLHKSIHLNKSLSLHKAN